MTPENAFQLICYFVNCPLQAAALPCTKFSAYKYIPLPKRSNIHLNASLSKVAGSNHAVARVFYCSNKMN